MKIKKGIIYSRVSTINQDTNRQTNDLREYAKKQDIEVIRVFTDVTSGKVKAKDRTGAKDMFSFLAANQIDIVLVSEISRLGRNAFDVQKNINTIVNDLKINLFIEQQNLTAFDKKGKSLQVIGAAEKMNAATGVFADDNNMIITDFENDRVLIYNHAGIIQQIITVGIDKPTDVIIKDGILYIANYKGKNIIKMERQ